MPIIVLTSRTDEAGKVEALDLGADDYVTKPFGVDELLARIRAALRHRLQQEGEKPLFHSGDLTVDLVRRIVTVRGAEVKLSPREYDILRLLVAACRQGADPSDDPARKSGAAMPTCNICASTSASSARRSNPTPSARTHIMTETGVGYRLRMLE